LDVFALRDRLVGDYESYVGSFIKIKDARIEDEVMRSLDEGLLWPDPLIQLNPSFEAGESIDETAERYYCSAPVRKGGDRGGPRTTPLYASAAQRKPELPVELSGVFELRAATL
jgi:hypothetical protein